MILRQLEPTGWEDYELIDSGNGEKLERFGTYILSRPEPQAVWSKSMSEEDWQKMAHAVFSRDKLQTEKGHWQVKRGMPDQWFVNYNNGAGLQLRFRLGMTSFKHVGLFPEQADNWRFIFEKCRNRQNPKILNLFAYTGGASLAARAGGADITHVDSVKAVIHWGRENMQASNLSDIRWVTEDALDFVHREVKRGRIYQGIILDPPAYGRGPEGQKWQLEDHIDQMLAQCARLLAKDGFFVLNLYSMGLSPLVAGTLVRSHFGSPANEDGGEFYFQDRYKRQLPLGVFYRFG